MDCKDRINEITNSSDSKFTETFLRGKLSKSSYFMESVAEDEFKMQSESNQERVQRNGMAEGFTRVLEGLPFSDR